MGENKDHHPAPLLCPLSQAGKMVTRVRRQDGERSAQTGEQGTLGGTLRMFFGTSPTPGPLGSLSPVSRGCEGQSDVGEGATGLEDLEISLNEGGLGVRGGRAGRGRSRSSPSLFTTPIFVPGGDRGQADWEGASLDQGDRFSRGAEVWVRVGKTYLPHYWRELTDGCCWL